MLYSRHAHQEMLGEEFGPIRDQEVYEATVDCSVVEEYPDDLP